MTIITRTMDLVKSLADKMVGASVNDNVSWAANYSFSLCDMLMTLSSQTARCLPLVSELAKESRSVLQEDPRDKKVYSAIRTALYRGLSENRVATQDAINLVKLRSWDAADKTQRSARKGRVHRYPCRNKRPKTDNV